METKNEHSPIKAARLAAGLTQVQLAEKMNCTQSEIWRWEMGKVNPTTSTLKKIAVALGCNASDLV